jgi:hypothetical protein
MTDRELLEAAAKAAALEGDALWAGDEAGISLWTPATGTHFWNPLTDDGDALRLAVKLKIDFRVYGQTPMAGAGLSQGLKWFEEVYDADPGAATRRAIVRAAAHLATTDT